MADEINKNVVTEHLANASIVFACVGAHAVAAWIDQLGLADVSVGIDRANQAHDCLQCGMYPYEGLSALLCSRLIRGQAYQAVDRALKRWNQRRIIQARLDDAIVYLKSRLVTMSPDKRLETIKRLSDDFCMACGISQMNHRSCQCWNDE